MASPTSSTTSLRKSMAPMPTSIPFAPKKEVRKGAIPNLVEWFRENEKKGTPCLKRTAVLALRFFALLLLLVPILNLLPIACYLEYIRQNAEEKTIERLTPAFQKYHDGQVATLRKDSEEETRRRGVFVSDHQATLERHETQLRAANAGLTEKLSELQTAFGKAEGIVQAHVEEREKNAAALATLRDQTASLERQLAEVRSELVRAQDATRTHDEQIRKDATVLTTLREQVASLEKQRATLEAQTQRDQAELEEQHRTIVTLTDNVGTGNQDVAAALETIRKLSEELASKNAIIHILQPTAAAATAW